MNGGKAASAPVESKSSVIAAGAKVEKLAGGFNFTEGAAVDAEGNIFFTDQPNDKIYRWSIDGKLSMFLEKTERSNGLYFDRNGDILSCADLNNRLISIDPKGRITVLADGFNGKLLNGPNDLWGDPKGGIYFTDPYYKRDYWDSNHAKQQDGEHVYYLKPGRKTLIRVTDDLDTLDPDFILPSREPLRMGLTCLVRPNGIVGTPDGKTLYVADIGADRTYRYKINKDGTLSDKKLFVLLGSDGMTLDNEGNVYLTGKGVTVFNAAGKKIEHIDIDAGWTANICFGGIDRKTLFITAQDSLYAIKMRVKGVE